MTAVTYGSLLADARRRLRAAGVDAPDLDARLLVAAAFGVPEIAVLTQPDAAADPEGACRLEEWVVRRIGGEPLARLLGHREFWGLSFALSAETLVPRPDSETLIEAALAAFPERAQPLRLLDLGTGTGCLLVSLLREYPNATGVGVDLSDDAVATARGNAVRLGVGERASIVQGNWDDGITGTFDLILSNPPYISSRDIVGLDAEVRLHDPRLALDGGPDGLDAYRALAVILPRRLAAGGVAVVELGVGQEIAVRDLMAAAGCQSSTRSDLGGIARALVSRLDENPLGNAGATR